MPSAGKNRAVSPSDSGGTERMLQWKPKLIALVAVLVIAAAFLGQFTWESVEQFTWL
jgi:hypothetical protein